MGKFTIANLKKTIYYLRRNGVRNTWNAARERLGEREAYHPEILSVEDRKRLKETALEEIHVLEENGGTPPFFSILVPAYGTNPLFLKELVQSVKEQAYPLWELLLLDASTDASVKEALENVCAEEGLPLLGETTAGGGVVRYLSLKENGGISENTNAGLPLAKGDYVGLLDHDDVLAPEALYEMAKAICGGSGSAGAAPMVLYSDEDKWDGEDRYYECNRKEDFNLDLLLSNNYVCHFLVMKTELFRELRLRRKFDGAQDYDLVLRAVSWLFSKGIRPEEAICHVPKVLYHWRCHVGSTAENPQSKTYAYEAGLRALQDFADGQGWQAKAVHLKHVGFYRLRYQDPRIRDDGSMTGESQAGPVQALCLLANRQDLGAVGGKIVKKAGAQGSVLLGGRMAEDGGICYEGLKEGYSGYLHRAVLTQDAEAVDLRCICVAKEHWHLFEEIVGVPYVAKAPLSAAGENDNFGLAIFDAGTLPEGADIKALSLKFCKALRETGKRILWDPEWVTLLQ